jgi:hypothetical protein
MRFFTPELFVRFNSPDEDEADRANQDWETALDEYRKHLDGIRDRLPPQVTKLADLCLHDAELLAWEQTVEPSSPPPMDPSAPESVSSATAIVSIRQEGKIVSLIYRLWDRVREHAAAEGWPFSKLRLHWLYDELDLAPNGRFLHRVLLSDGRVLEIPFLSVIVYTLPIFAANEGVRQSA